VKIARKNPDCGAAIILGFMSVRFRQRRCHVRAMWLLCAPAVGPGEPKQRAYSDGAHLGSVAQIG
jgi:hypothetical protein